MLCWHRGSFEVRRRLQEMSMPLDEFIDNIGRMVVARTPGVGVWLTKVEHGASPVMLHHVKNNCVMHRTVILLTVVSDRRPRVPFAERLAIEKLGHGFHRIQLRLGFMQTPNIPLALENARSHGFDVALDDVHYYIAHEVVVRRDKDSAMWRESFAIFSFLTRIASRAPDFFKIPLEGRSEVGFRVEI
jgi:KUP system potassium uptake protein